MRKYCFLGGQRHNPWSEWLAYLFTCDTDIKSSNMMKIRVLPAATQHCYNTSDDFCT